ncbi:hypothetical protein PCI56_11170 [Plesiomonas shigelloides subsp. oncorhynchi]|nr:hypothetical protein [Plesiomonas shigelloides]
MADLNKTIVEQGGSSNEMEDRRQSLLDELAEYTQVSTVPKDDGSMNVLIGGGHTLVSGGDSAKIKMVDGSPDPRQSQMAISWGNSSKPLNGQSLGGKLGAMFEMRDVHIPKAMDQIGLMAIGIADAINKQQQQGLISMAISVKTCSPISIAIRPSRAVRSATIRAWSWALTLMMSANSAPVRSKSSLTVKITFCVTRAVTSWKS